MNGTKLFLDTNAMIAYLGGSKSLPQVFSAATWVGTSSICVVEFLSYPALEPADELLFNDFIKNIEVIGLSNDPAFLQTLATFKKGTKLKLPDAVIASQALAAGASLVSNDKHFNDIPNLNLINFERP